MERARFQAQARTAAADGWPPPRRPISRCRARLTSLFACILLLLIFSAFGSLAGALYVRFVSNADRIAARREMGRIADLYSRDAQGGYVGSHTHIGCHTPQSFAAAQAHATAAEVAQMQALAAAANGSSRTLLTPQQAAMRRAHVNGLRNRLDAKVWTVMFPSSWFGGGHPWAKGRVNCPSGCSIVSFRAPRVSDTVHADVLLFHPAEGLDSSITPALFPHVPGQRRVLFAAENFPKMFTPAYAGTFNAEMSYRPPPASVFRDATQYVLRIIESMLPAVPPDGYTPGLSWNDLPLPRPLPASRRRSLSVGSMTFASSHCSSRSGREALLEALALVMPDAPLIMFGECTDCMPSSVMASAARVGAGVELVSKTERQLQHFLFERCKFHLAFENARCEGYVTEKAYYALVRGQVPVFLGAPDVHRYMPPGSYINVDDFDSVEALAARLRELDRNSSAYEELQAWRAVPIAQYGDILAQEFMLALNIAAGVAGQEKAADGSRSADSGLVASASEPAGAAVSSPSTEAAGTSAGDATQDLVAISGPRPGGRSLRTVHNMMARRHGASRVTADLMNVYHPERVATGMEAWYMCSMCHALERADDDAARAAQGSTTGIQVHDAGAANNSSRHSVNESRCAPLQPFAASCALPWPAHVGQGRRSLYA